MTESTDFPTQNPLQPSIAGRDAFVARLNATGSSLDGTYLGGSGSERGFGIAVDAFGSAYVKNRTRVNSGTTALNQRTILLDQPRLL